MIDLKKFFTKINKKEEKISYFLAVEIDFEIVKSALWAVVEGETKIIKIGVFKKWDGETQDSLLEAVDYSISSACEECQEEPQGVIFGLLPSWVEKEKIVSDKKEWLKYLCQKLSLKPLGFVVILESLVAYLKKEEGIPLNAILINLEENQVYVSLVVLGKVKGIKQVDRSEDLAADVKEGLARFGKIDNFPARMIVYDGNFDFEECRQQLVSFDWQKDLPFLHFPKVEILAENKTIKAIALAGGAEVAKSLGFSLKTEEKEKSAEENVSPAINQSAQKLGFVEEKDILEIVSQEEAREKKEKIYRQESKSEDLAVLQTKEKESVFQKSSFNPFASIWQKVKNFFSSFFHFFSFAKKTKFIFILSPFLFLLTIFIIFNFLFKARVLIYFKKEKIEKELSLTIDSKAEKINEKEKILPAIIQEIELQKSKTSPATGKKLIGEKAKGEVVIYNKTNINKTFSKGAILTGPHNLKFALTEAVDVASRSSESTEEGEQILYGKAVAKVIALDIGSEANLSAGNVFTFKDYASAQFSAKNENPFSGGSSQEIKVVSSQDKKNLRDTLQKELKEEALEKLTEKTANDFILFPDSLKLEILKENYSKETGEEAEEFTLELKVKAKVFTYSKNDLVVLAFSLFQNELPDGFTFKAQDIEFQTEDLNITKDEKLNAKILIKINLLPKIEKEALISKLKGKKLEEAKRVLEPLPNFSSAKIEIYPNFFGFIARLPFWQNKIALELEEE